MYLGSNDNGYGDDDVGSTLYGYWQSAQEYTLTLLNEVYDEYKYCTLCMDYPTYQDGYYIGDYGTDDDDLINQCWKFHSHDSYTCESECIALGDAQGSILSIDFNGVTYGQDWDGASEVTSSNYKSDYAEGESESKMDHFKANAWLTFNGVLFIATFLAFSVARSSRGDKSSEKRRSLLSRHERELAGRQRKKKRSKSSKNRARSRSYGEDKSRSSRKSSRSSGGRSSSSKKKRSASASSRSKKSARDTLIAQY